MNDRRRTSLDEHGTFFHRTFPWTSSCGGVFILRAGPSPFIEYRMRHTGAPFSTEGGFFPGKLYVLVCLIVH